MIGKWKIEKLPVSSCFLDANEHLFCTLWLQETKNETISKIQKKKSYVNRGQPAKSSIQGVYGQIITGKPLYLVQLKPKFCIMNF